MKTMISLMVTIKVQNYRIDHDGEHQKKVDEIN